MADVWQSIKVWGEVCGMTRAAAWYALKRLPIESKRETVKGWEVLAGTEWPKSKPVGWPKGKPRK